MRLKKLLEALMAIAIAAAPVHAADRSIPFQARLTDAANQPLNGVFVVTFAI